MSKIYLVFGDKCYMFVLARPLEHTCIYHQKRTVSDRMGGPISLFQDTL